MSAFVDEELGVDENGLVRKHHARKAGDFSKELRYHKHRPNAEGQCGHCVQRLNKVAKRNPYRLFPALSHLTTEELDALRRKPQGQLPPVSSPRSDTGSASTPRRGKKKKRGKKKGKGKGKVALEPVDKRPPWGPANPHKAKDALERRSYVAAAAPYSDPERAERHWNRVMRNKRIAGDFVPSGQQSLAKERVSTVVYLESPSELHIRREHYRARQKAAEGKALEFDLTMQHRHRWQEERRAQQRAERREYQQRLLQTLPRTPIGEDRSDSGSPGPEGLSRVTPLDPDNIAFIDDELGIDHYRRHPRPIAFNDSTYEDLP